VPAPLRGARATDWRVGARFTGVLARTDELVYALEHVLSAACAMARVPRQPRAAYR
jgi:hypothetical protein